MCSHTRTDVMVLNDIIDQAAGGQYDDGSKSDQLGMHVTYFF